MKKSIILTLLISTFNFITAQTTLNIALIDCKTKEPIAYAHIGIAEKGIGTISNEQGSFLLKIPAENIDDTLTISYVGYETKRLLINSIKSNIELCPANIQLKEVVIIPKKEKILGRTKGTGNSAYIFQGIGSGGEIATKISNNKSVVLRKVGVYIKSKECDTLKMRINLYKADKNKIGEPINTIPFIWQTASIKEGWLDYELPQIISIDDDFFVSLEVLKSSNKGKRCTVMFQGNYQLIKSDNYMREKSLDKWQIWKIDFPIRVIANYD